MFTLSFFFEVLYIFVVEKLRFSLPYGFPVYGNLQTRLQAQAAGAPYSHPLSNVTSRMAFFGPHMV